MNGFESLISPISIPILNALVFLDQLIGDLGIGIILITLFVRLLLVPLAAKQMKAQRRMQALQPELKKLQEKHKGDRETLAKEMMAFYQREGVNPASSCIPTLVQIPFLIGIFFGFKYAVEEQHFDKLYSFVPHPAHIDPTMFGVLDLSTIGVHPANLIFGVLAAILTYFQSKMLMPQNGESMPGMSKQLMYLFPALMIIFSVTLPAALALYWASTTGFILLQQYYIIKRMPLAEAKVEAKADWNIANPEDPVDGPTGGKGAQKKLKGGSSGKATKKGGATITVRRRGKK